MDVNVRVLRSSVINGKDVFPGDKVKVAASVARRLIAMGKVEEIKRGRPRKGENAVQHGDGGAADDAGALEGVADGEA